MVQLPVLPVREDLRGEVPYGAPQLDVPVRLNVNENPYDPTPDVIASISECVSHAAASLNRYPDRDCEALRADLADYLAEESGVQIDPECIWAANGSNEIMLQLLQAFGGPRRTALSFAPTYSMYPEYARDAFTHYVAGTRQPDFSLDFSNVRCLLEREHPAILLLASPNNPTGTAVTPEELHTLLQMTAASGPRIDADTYAATVVVVDEAYGEFRREGVPSALELLKEYPHLVVTRTMSKAFGAAGLRLGYMAASRDIISQVMLVRLPYHLSAITQAAARAALAHRHSLMAQVAQIRAQRDLLRRQLQELGYTCAKSDANFVFFGKFSDRHAVWQALLNRGVLIREVGPEGFLRVSVGTPEENKAFIAALKEAIS